MLPVCPIPDHGIEDGQQFSGKGDEGDLGWLSRRSVTVLGRVVLSLLVVGLVLAFVMGVFCHQTGRNMPAGGDGPTALEPGADLPVTAPQTKVLAAAPVVVRVAQHDVDAEIGVELERNLGARGVVVLVPVAVGRRVGRRSTLFGHDGCRPAPVFVGVMSDAPLGGKCRNDEG